MRKSLVPETIENYINLNLVRPSEIAKSHFERTLELTMSGMCSSHEVVAVLQVLAKLCLAKRIVEVGVFTGFSSLHLAEVLPEGGQLVGCDISEEWTAIGKEFWHQAGLNHKIELKIGPALETLKSQESNSFDMAFIDCDKPNYPAYYEECLRIVRQGGLIVLDNMLWSGRVADAEHQDVDTMTLRNLGTTIIDDPRVTSAMVTVGDGLLLAVKN